MDLSGSHIGPAILGLRFWIIVWYVILGIGSMGLIGASLWAWRARWANWDELLRGVGTVATSLGMLSLLQHISVEAGQYLLILAVVSFGLAFLHGRPRDRTALRLVPPTGVTRPRFS